ncbi:hypothetical protein SAMN06297229_1805 [Pseudidiomarina planktonica]|uniref:Uncharacterized protein n=1 Tax=Pseudidiomarina planktonica TaxID=1323738 RepID=A0A1Y6FY33_9GAMM|nr:hypothetical protein [Pseudidiomarina planktonica]RUO64023.1 hypothetical protein CWI77_09935 [Pseudidiomarina planktonica]SMQ79879.1 hypothetical protein SAMN06297229_1805 [Pseudidiomarina planktonica]
MSGSDRYLKRYHGKTKPHEYVLAYLVGAIALAIFLIPALIYAYILIFLFEWIFFDISWSSWITYAVLFGIAAVLFILGVGRSSIDGAFWKVFAFKGK